MEYPTYVPAEKEIINTDLLIAPPENGHVIDLEKGPNVKSLPDFGELEDAYKVPVLLKMEDNISTDEILRAGAEVLPFRSNIPEISKWSFSIIDDTFFDRAKDVQQKHGGHVVVAGENYAQGSSPEHAALAPRYLGQVAAIAKSYARIGWQNLVNFGIVPLEFVNNEDYEKLQQDHIIRLEGLREALESGENVKLVNESSGDEIELTYNLSDRQVQVILAGGVINYFRMKNVAEEA
jgi:aconitate hydratase